MPEPPADERPPGEVRRLRLSTRSAVLTVAMLGLTLVLLRLFAASIRVIGWIAVAALLASFLHPIVVSLSRRMPRGAALALVLLVGVGSASLIAFGAVSDLAEELRELQRDAPRAARAIERSERFGETATEFRLAERTEEFVDELPQRLRGGTVEDAIRSAATRSVAFLATGVLTIFFVIHGPRLLRSAAAQISDVRRREVVVGVTGRAYDRTWHYVGGSLSMAALAGLIAWGLAFVLDLPGAALLGLWMAMWDLVPLIGAAVGATPLVLLAAAESPTEAAVVFVIVIAFQLLEAFHLQRWVEARSVHLGPFVTIVVGMVGLELYGIGGALVGLVAAIFAASLADELAPLGDEDDRAPGPLRRRRSPPPVAPPGAQPAEPAPPAS